MHQKKNIRLRACAFKEDKMKIFNNDKHIEKIICNCCGREIKVENDILHEEIMSVDINWGYFSKHDGENHKFDLCGDCYEKLIGKFKIPIERTDNIELI